MRNRNHPTLDTMTAYAVVGAPGARRADVAVQRDIPCGSTWFSRA